MKALESFCKLAVDSDCILSILAACSKKKKKRLDGFNELSIRGCYRFCPLSCSNLIRFPQFPSHFQGRYCLVAACMVLLSHPLAVDSLPLRLILHLGITLNNWENRSI